VCLSAISSIIDVILKNKKYKKIYKNLKITKKKLCVCLQLSSIIDVILKNKKYKKIYKNLKNKKNVVVCINIDILLYITMAWLNVPFESNCKA
jgi:rRNA processing protein Krr1/Pno1